MGRPLGVAALWILVAAPAAAAGGEGIESLFYPTLNILLLLAVLLYFARKPMQTFFADRRSVIETEIADAAELQRRAEQRYAQWHRKLVDLDEELETIRRTARERAEAERARILEDAQVSADRIRSDASLAIEQELRRAKERLREEAADLAVELADGMLRQRVTSEDRERLIDEFIARVEGASGDAGQGS
jgi:F-type H+-transporting ATPase subunit b